MLQPDRIQQLFQTIFQPEEEQYDPETNWSVLEHSEQQFLRDLTYKISFLDLSIRAVLQRARKKHTPSRISFCRHLVTRRLQGHPKE